MTTMTMKFHAGDKVKLHRGTAYTVLGPLIGTVVWAKRLSSLEINLVRVRYKVVFEGGNWEFRTIDCEEGDLKLLGRGRDFEEFGVTEVHVNRRSRTHIRRGSVSPLEEGELEPDSPFRTPERQAFRPRRGMEANTGTGVRYMVLEEVPTTAEGGEGNDT